MTSTWLPLSPLRRIRTGSCRPALVWRFAFYASAARAVMIFTGTPAASGNLHASTFGPDEQAVSRVATAMLTRYLASVQVLGRGAAGS